MVKKISLLLFVFMGISAFAVSDDVKFLYYGWDSPDTSRFVAEYETVKDLPFDGHIIAINGKDSNGPFQAGMLWQPRRYEEEGFAQAMADAEKIAEIVDRTGVELFVILWANPGTLDWFDDAGWDNLKHNLRMTARVAKRAKIKGFLFDPEPYTDTRPFGFIASESKRPFRETADMVHQRGAEFMQVIAEEYPELIFLTMGMWDWQWYFNKSYDTADDFEKIMSGDVRYGLLTAFSNGLLETIPENMRFINASEMAYRIRTPEQFLSLMRGQRGRNSVAERMVDPDLRDKFRRHVEGGFGLFIDPFLDSKDADAVYDYFRNAAKYTDQYVWVYAERGKFFPKGKGSIPDAPMWEDAIPGITNAIAVAKDDFPGTPGTVNLIKNPGFTDNADGYANWLADWSKGRIDYEPTSGRSGGAVTMTDTVDSCWNQGIKVTPGEKYQVSVYCRTEGNVNPKLSVRWKNADGKWLDENRDTSHYFFSSDWEKGTVNVEVPGNAAYLEVVMYCNSAFREPKGKAWFDDVEVYKY